MGWVILMAAALLLGVSATAGGFQYDATAKLAATHTSNAGRFEYLVPGDGTPLRTLKGDSLPRQVVSAGQPCTLFDAAWLHQIRDAPKYGDRPAHKGPNYSVRRIPDHAPDSWLPSTALFTANGRPVVQQSVHHLIPWNQIKHFINVCYGKDDLGSNPTPVIANQDGTFSVSAISMACLQGFCDVYAATERYSSENYYNPITVGGEAGQSRDRLDDIATRVCWAVGNTFPGPTQVSAANPLGRIDPAAAFDQDIYDVLLPEDRRHIDTALRALEPIATSAITVKQTVDFYAAFTAMSRLESQLEGNRLSSKYNWAITVQGAQDCLTQSGTQVEIVTYDSTSMYKPCRVGGVGPLGCPDATRDAESRPKTHCVGTRLLGSWHSLTPAVCSSFPVTSNADCRLPNRHGISALPQLWRSRVPDDRPGVSFDTLLNPQTGPCGNIALDAGGQKLLCPSNAPNGYPGLRIDQQARTGVNWQTLKSDARYLYQYRQATVSAGQTFASAHVPVELVGMLNQKHNSKTRNTYCIYPSPVKLQVPAGAVLTALDKSSGPDGNGDRQCWKPLVVPAPGLPTNGLPHITAATQCTALPSAVEELVDVPTNRRARGVTCEPPPGLVSRPAPPKNRAAPAAVAGPILRAGANSLAGGRVGGASAQSAAVKMAWDAAVTAAAKAIKLPKMNRRQWAKSVAAGAAMWRKQASVVDGAFLTQFRGPVEALSAYTAKSPEVQRILALAKGGAKATLAASEAQFSQKAIIAATVSSAVAAAAAASASGKSLAATAVMPSMDNDTPVAVASTGLVHAQSSITATAAFAWDGDVTAGAAFELGTTAGGLTEDALDVAAANFLTEIKASLPYFNWEMLPLSTTAVLDLHASYDQASGTVTFRAESGNYMYLLGIVATQISSTFGISLPDTSLATNSPIPTTTVAITFSTSTGLQQISLGLGGSWTAQTLMQAIGASWPADNDAFTIAAPSVVYNTLPVALQFTMLVSIPALGVTNMASSLTVQPGGAVSLQLVTQFSPVQGVRVNTMSVAAVGGSGLMVSATGMIASTGVSIAGRLTKSATSLTLTATNAQVVAMLREIFPSDMLPEFLLSFIQPLTFSVVTLEYNSAATGRARFGIVAVPDINRAAVLKDMLEAVGLDPADLALRIGPSELAFGVSKTYSVSLPSPFTGPGQTSFSLAIDGVSRAVQLHGRFSASLMISGIRNPIPVDVGAGIAAGASNGVSLSMSGATLAAVEIADFPFVQVGTLNLSASVTPKPLVVNHLTLAGAVTVLGAQGSGLFTFDRATGATAMQMQVENVDFQGMLSAIGVNVNLGFLNFQLRTVRASFSTVNIPSLNIPAGMYFRSSVSFLGMNTDTEFLMTTQGVDFAMMYDLSEFSRVFNEQVLGRIQGFINAAGDAMRGAGSALVRHREEAERKLQEAQNRLAQADRDVTNALNVFNEAKATVDRDLDKARRDVQNARQAFENARSNANSALENARRDFAAADRAFNEARDRAYADLERAKQDVDTAQRNFDNAIRDANNRLNSAQATVDNLTHEYNRLNGMCSWWRWWNCVAAGAVWVARNVAIGVLEAARAFLNSVVTGVARGALDVARGTLIAAQRTADGVLSGTHFVTRQTAIGVLEAAQRVADGVLVGTQAAALATADAVLIAANAAANGVLTGTHAVALNTARAGLEIARAGVTAAEAVARESLNALSAALTAVGNALASVRLTNFLRLNGFGVRLTLTRERIAIGARYDVVIAGQGFSGELRLDVQNPLEAIINALAGEALRSIKAAFTQIAPFLP